MKAIVQIFCFTLICFLMGCVDKTSADSASITLPKPIPQIIEGKAKITEERASNLKVVKTDLHSKSNLSKVYFADENNGWVTEDIVSDDEVVGSNLYRTADGGKSWKKTIVKTEKDAQIREIRFVNSKVGWMNIQRYGVIDTKSSESWLMKTNDGGENWENLAIQDFTDIDQVIFFDEKTGWLIGSTHNPKNVYDTKKFLRITNDGGKTWNEIGRQLFENSGFEESDARQMITGLIAESPEKFKVVTWAGKLFETLDGGTNWKQFGPQFEFPMQTIPNNFGKLGNTSRLRMANGTWSYEGIYSYIATEKDEDWKILWTDEPICFYDFLFISENEILAVGRSWVENSKKDHEENGVIYYTSDAGETWKNVYRSKFFTAINSISKISESHFIAVGDKGLMITIEKN